MKKLIIVIIPVLVALVFLFFFVAQNPITPEIPNMQPLQEVKNPDWNNYENEYMGLTLKHPQFLEIENMGRYSFLVLNPEEQGVIGNTNFVYTSYVPIFDTTTSGEIYNANYIQNYVLLNLQVSESANVAGDPQFEEWFTYTRLEDREINGLTYKVFENTKSWEFPPETKEVRYIHQKGDSVYILGYYTNNETLLNEVLAEEVIETVEIGEIVLKEPSKEITEITIPEEWQTYSDQRYELTVAHPVGWEVTPAALEGAGALIVLDGENNDESIRVEIGKHDAFSKRDNQTLRQVELNRSPGTEFEEERNININSLDVYQQLVPLISGSAASKEYGIYNLFELEGELYFLEAYTNDPFAQFELVSQILGSVNTKD